MPSNADFRLDILVGSQPLPEYSRNLQHYVESNLSTPVSYSVTSEEVAVTGEKETQVYPVTPYEIRVSSLASQECYFRVMVDGIKVKGLSLKPGHRKTVKGFKDAGSIREFLFSMPRIPKTKEDRVDNRRCLVIGKVVVECWNARLKKSTWANRSNAVDFSQAAKSDSDRVTNGQFTMVTSKVGRAVQHRRTSRLLDAWKLLDMRSTMTVTYHMGHTLQEMGFTLRPITQNKHPSGVSGVTARNEPNNLNFSQRNTKSASVSSLSSVESSDKKVCTAHASEIPCFACSLIKTEKDTVDMEVSSTVISVDDDDGVTGSSFSDVKPTSHNNREVRGQLQHIGISKLDTVIDLTDD